MAKKPQVDIRKLKDEVADSLKKQKWDRAVDLLEQLILAEPKDMSHRLKLGDAYRRLEQPAKAIISYQQAATFFGEQGQVIKAIGAVKIILEIDPRNVEAQRRLQQMNKQRAVSKVSLASIGLKRMLSKKPNAGGSARPAPSPSAELEEDGDLAGADAGMDEPLELEPLTDDEPLELDDGSQAKPLRALPKRGFNPTGAATPLVPPLRELPDEAILEPEPEPEDLVASEDDDEVVPDEEGSFPPGGADEPGFGEIDLDPPRPPPAARKRAKKDEADEIVLDDEPEPPRRRAAAPARGSARPLADLVAAGAEEEVELLSISSDEEPAADGPSEAELVEDADLLDHAFDRVAGTAGRTRKLPSKQVPLFDDLSQAAFVELVNQLGYHRHMPGDLIIREGDPGHSFFIIVEGKVRIFKAGPDEREITLAHLGEGSFFGEMALLSGTPRTANVIAEEETELLEVTDIVLRQLAGKHPQVVRSLKNFYRQRLLNNVMTISPLFKDFDPAERKTIIEKFRMKQADDGEVIIAEASNSDGLYVVLHGSVQVSKNDHDGAVELAQLKEGDVFGEMSLLTRQPATATVSSVGNSILLRLPRATFQELVVTHPQVLELVSHLSEKRRSATKAILEGTGEGNGMYFV